MATTRHPCAGCGPVPAGVWLRPAGNGRYYCERCLLADTWQAAQPDAWLTTEQVANVLGVTVGRVRQLIAGVDTTVSLPAIKMGRDWLIRPADLEPLRQRPKVGRPPRQTTAPPTAEQQKERHRA